MVEVQRVRVCAQRGASDERAVLCSLCRYFPEPVLFSSMFNTGARDALVWAAQEGLAP